MKEGPTGPPQGKEESVTILELSTLEELVARGTTVNVWEHGISKSPGAIAMEAVL